MPGHLGCVQAVDTGGWVMVHAVQVVDGEAAVVVVVVVVVAAGVVAAGAGHGLGRSLHCQLAVAPLQTVVTPLAAVRARLQPPKPWIREKSSNLNV